jgi:hypothetical protein
MLEYFLQRCPKDCTRKPPSKNKFTTYQAQITGPELSNSVYADYNIKYQENCHKIHFSVDNSCNSKAISTSNTLKQIYKGEK